MTNWNAVNFFSWIVSAGFTGYIAYKEDSEATQHPLSMMINIVTIGTGIWVNYISRRWAEENYPEGAAL